MLIYLYGGRICDDSNTLNVTLCKWVFKLSSILNGSGDAYSIPIREEALIRENTANTISLKTSMNIFNGQRHECTFSERVGLQKFPDGGVGQLYSPNNLTKGILQKDIEHTVRKQQNRFDWVCA